MIVGRYDELPAATRRRLFVRALVRPTLSTTGLVLIYYLLPLGDGAPRLTATTLFVALVIVVALITWHVRTIRTATYPRLRAIETTAVSLPLFLLLFAAAQGARVLVMIQMIGDLLLVGIVARLVLGAVRTGIGRQERGTQPE